MSTQQEFRPVLPKLFNENIATGPEKYHGFTAKEIARKLADIYMDYCSQGLVVSYYSAHDCGLFGYPWTLDNAYEMLATIEKTFGLSCSMSVDYLIHKPAKDVFQLLLAEMRAEQYINAGMLNGSKSISR